MNTDKNLCGNIESSDRNKVKVSYKGFDALMKIHSKNCSVSEKIRATGVFYEEDFLKCLANLLRSERADLVLDIGAHIGNHTVFFGKVCGSRVIAIEPSTQSYALLRENIRINELTDQVIAINCAVGEENGSGHLKPNYKADLGTNSLLKSNDGDPSGDATPIFALDSLATDWDLSGFTLMKIDVEGFELNVLRGAYKTITAHRPVITTEVLDTSQYLKIKTLLSEIGYYALTVMNATQTIIWVTDVHEHKHREAITRLRDSGTALAIEQTIQKNKLAIQARENSVELRQLRSWHQEHEKQLSNLHTEHEKQLSNLHTEHEKQLSNLRQGFEKSLKKASKEIRLLREALTKASRQLALRKTISRHVRLRLRRQTDKPEEIQRFLGALIKKDFIPRDTLARPLSREQFRAEPEHTHLPVEIDQILNETTTGDVLVTCSSYPGVGREYGGEFIRTRVDAYLKAGLHATVVEFSNKNKTAMISSEQDGQLKIIRSPLGCMEEMIEKFAACNAKVAAHAPSPELQKHLQEKLDNERLIFWHHGFEVRDYRRLAFNYTTAELAVLRERLDALNEVRLAAAGVSFDNDKITKVFVSHFLKNIAERDACTEAKNSRIIPNFIDGETYRAVEKTPSDANRILLIRSFGQRNYGNDIAIEAIRLLSNRPEFEKLQITIRGFGRFFQPLTQPLVDFPNIDCVETYLSPQEMADLHCTHGVFLCPSRHDTQGVTMGEAMSSGLVCITNRVAGISEFIDEECGVLVPPDDPWLFAEAIWQLTKHADLMPRLSREAARRARAQCGFDKTIDSEIKLIRGD